MKIKAVACIAWLLLSGCDQAPAPEDSFAGLGSDAADFAQVVPGKVFSFPRTTGPMTAFVSNGGTSPPTSRMPKAMSSACNGRCFAMR